MSWFDTERVLVLTTCFITGFIVLTVELASLRLFAPYFGASVYVTGIVINTILLALATGYLFGGHVADRSESGRIPYLVLLIAAVYLSVSLIFSAPLLRATAALPLVYGAGLAMVAMFLMPMVLLAFVPPYFIRQLSSSDTVGKVSGRIYALSTVGSIAGGLFTSFFLLPSLGSRTTFQAAVILLFVNATVGLARSDKRAIVFIFFAALVFVPEKREGSYVYRGESAYNVITITASQGRLYLRLNDGFGFHSQTLDPESMLSGEYYDSFLIAPMMSRARHILVLGNGAGTSMQQTAHFFDTDIDGVEIDPRLTALGRQYFGLRISNTLRVFHEDARVFIDRNTTHYDAVYVDVYAGGPYIPFQVTTVEFYEQVRRSLAPGGVVAVNVPFYAAGTVLGDHLLHTISAVFPVTWLSDGMVYGSMTGKGVELLKARLADHEFPPVLEHLGKRFLTDKLRVTRTSREDIFTDDLAPVDRLTFDILEKRVDRGRQTIE